MPATPTLHAQKPKSELDWHSFRKQAQGNGKIDPGFPRGFFECLQQSWICCFQTSYYMRKKKTGYWFKLLWIFDCLIYLIIVLLVAGGFRCTQLDAI